MVPMHLHDLVAQMLDEPSIRPLALQYSLRQWLEKHLAAKMAKFLSLVADAIRTYRKGDLHALLAILKEESFYEQVDRRMWLRVKLWLVAMIPKTSWQVMEWMMRAAECSGTTPEEELKALKTPTGYKKLTVAIRVARTPQGAEPCAFLDVTRPPMPALPTGGTPAHILSRRKTKMMDDPLLG